MEGFATGKISTEPPPEIPRQGSQAQRSLVEQQAPASTITIVSAGAGSIRSTLPGTPRTSLAWPRLPLHPSRLDIILWAGKVKLYWLTARPVRH